MAVRNYGESWDGMAWSHATHPVCEYEDRYGETCSEKAEALYLKPLTYRCRYHRGEMI